MFPRRETTDLPYSLGGAWEGFFDAVLDYCSEVVLRAGTDQRRQRLNFWGTLALMRSAASSPAAALRSLRTRMATQLNDADEESLRERVFDGSEDAMVDDDGELPANNTDPALAELMTQAERLQSAAIMKTLGATRAQVLGITVAEFTVLGTLAGIIGAIAATGAAWLIATRAVHVGFTLNIPFALIAIALALCVVLAAASYLILRIWRQPVADVFREWY